VAACSPAPEREIRQWRDDDRRRSTILSALDSDFVKTKGASAARDADQTDKGDQFLDNNSARSGPRVLTATQKLMLDRGAADVKLDLLPSRSNGTLRTEQRPPKTPCRPSPIEWT
jgi:hypothetical protein